MSKMDELSVSCIFAVERAKHKFLALFKDEEGEVNIIAIMLILAIVIMLAVAFRKQITSIFNSVWESVDGDFKKYNDADPVKGMDG